MVGEPYRWHIIYPVAFYMSRVSVVASGSGRVRMPSGVRVRQVDKSYVTSPRLAEMILGQLEGVKKKNAPRTDNWSPLYDVDLPGQMICMICMV